jgi:hypothetical protein
MPQTQGAGTIYAAGPGTSFRGPLYMKTLGDITTGLNIGSTGTGYTYYPLFDASGNLLAPVGAVLGGIQYKKLYYTAAQINAMFGTAITLLAAPTVATQSVQIIDALFCLNYGSAAFTAGGVVSIQQNTINICTTTAALMQSTSSLVIQPAFPGMGTSQSNGAVNAATTMTNATQAFATGTGCTVDVHLWYSVFSF